MRSFSTEYARSGHCDYSLHEPAAEEMLHALKIWRCDAAMKLAIGAARSETGTVNSQGADEDEAAGVAMAFVADVGDEPEAVSILRSW
ncbi:hypothetical protein [Leisingera sp. M523]|uniref:hypothetical protein n=1 Tax=Leisingera sp. M523 TaxID=2867013 RepID=UPI0021A642CF|nr:hypothetical protein [Leisingera sp. M523]UWQ28070.1 hypothetical protein K3557_14990 [Leisingera sp. M523]